MTYYAASTYLPYRCPWAYYTALFETLRSSLHGTNRRKNSAASIGGNNQNQGGTTALIDRRIAELCIKEEMVRPFHPEAVQPCSYDVHLGPNALVERRGGFQPLDLSSYDDKRPYYMSPGEFILGETVEFIKLPDNVEAHLHLVSSRAREGLNHSLSGLVDCSWQGKLTLELKNILKYGHIPIYPNLRVAQLSFWEYSENAQRPYRGRYFGDTKVSMVKDGADVLHSQ